MGGSDGCYGYSFMIMRLGAGIFLGRHLHALISSVLALYIAMILKSMKQV